MVKNCEHIIQCETCNSNICSYCIEDCDGCAIESCNSCYIAHMQKCESCANLVCPMNFAGKVCLSCDAQANQKV